MESVECLVVGAGVIGLAVARALARAGREVIVVESEEWDWRRRQFAQQAKASMLASIIRQGSSKTRLCVDSKAMLCAFCQEFGVPRKAMRQARCVAAEAEERSTSSLRLSGLAEANSVTDLTWLSGKESARSRPRWSPIVRYCHPPRPALSIAMRSCSRCAALPKPMAR